MAPDINLLPKRDRSLANKRLFFIIFGIVFALLFIGIGTQYVIVSKNIDRLQAMKQTEEAGKSQLQAKVAALETPVVADLATSVQFIESVSYPVSPLLTELLKYIPENTYVRSYKFTENTITVDVDFETLSHVSTYIGDVDGSAYFTDVKVESISTFSPKDDEEEKTTSFDEVERFANTITVTIEPSYLRNGGVVQ
ncbi:PilN domain-containing protein [Sporosarcina sp. HYO08]|uniref:PilN domain-containing protein n=1 Tax=Sporosarcina sp. HYO08 TaxID=1759557 RepID=UPI00079A5B7B|nr:PilN domain-containing protein [Sporosarcina sp. HYO08]KXH87315.1 hypothetical protein AU377_01705 [Sporosarcina sp. HYO08]